MVVCGRSGFTYDPAMADKPKKTSASSKPQPPTPAAAPAKKPTQLELMMAARAKKKADSKSGPVGSAKSLGVPQGSSGGASNTHTKGGSVGVARRTAPGA